MFVWNCVRKRSHTFLCLFFFFFAKRPTLSDSLHTQRSPVSAMVQCKFVPACMVLRVARVWRVQCATRPTRTVPKMAWYAERTPNHIFFSTPDALCLVFVVHWRAGTSCCERAADRFARLQVHNRDSNNRRLALSGGFDLACRLRTSTLIFFSGAVLCSVTLCGPSLVAEKDFDDAGWTDVGLPLGFGEPGVTFAQDNTDLYATSPVSLSLSLSLSLSRRCLVQKILVLLTSVGPPTSPPPPTCTQYWHCNRLCSTRV